MEQNHNQQTLLGIVLGVYTVIASLTLNQWAVVIGMFGVVIQGYFAWRRHVRETREFEYNIGLRLDRRSADCARCDLARRKEDREGKEQ